jgi:agmatinase
MSEPRIESQGNIGQIDASVVPRFAGLGTFARLPQARDVTKDLDVAIVGIPFDAGVSYRPGARFGPAHVRESSRLLRPFNPAQGVSPFAQIQVADAGDIAVNPFDISQAIREVEMGARELLERSSSLITIGGDHTIALPLLRAMYARMGNPIAVVHFDAHLDTWDTYFGADITHGTPFRRAMEEGLIDSEASMHLGIRGPLYDQGDLIRDAQLGFQVVTSDDLDSEGSAGIIERIHNRIGDRPVYVSLDIDVLDPAFAPGTGTPEAGGWSSRELLRILRGMKGLNFVGFDVVEVSPAYDHAQVTGVAASHIIYDMVSLVASNASA